MQDCIEFNTIIIDHNKFNQINNELEQWLKRGPHRRHTAMEIEEITHNKDGSRRSKIAYKLMLYFTSESIFEAFHIKFIGPLRGTRQRNGYGKSALTIQ